MINLQKRLWHTCFPVNCAKFLRIRSLQNTPERVLLNSIYLVFYSLEFLKKTHTDRGIFFLIYIYIYIHEYLLVCLKRNNSQIFKSIAGAKNIFSGAHVVGTTCFNKYFLFLVITRQHFFNKKLSLPLRCFSTTIFLLSLQQVI